VYLLFGEIRGIGWHRETRLERRFLLVTRANIEDLTEHDARVSGSRFVMDGCAKRFWGVSLHNIFMYRGLCDWEINL